MNKFTASAKQLQLPHQDRCLREHRGQCRALYAPTEAVDKQRTQHYVEHHGEYRGHHGRLGTRRGPEQCVESEIEVSNHVSDKYHPHEVACIRHRLLCCSKEKQNGVYKDEHQNSQNQTHYNIEHHHVAQYFLSHVVVFFTKLDRHERACPHTDHRTESRRHLHHRKSERDARNSHRPNALANENSVNNIIQRRRRHGHHGRHGVLQQKTPYRLVAKFQKRGILFFLCDI